jgi:hypothetical protein
MKNEAEKIDKPQGNGVLPCVSGSDILILLKRINPTEYEIHRSKIDRTRNLILTTTDSDFAHKLVNAYNHYR